VRIENVVSGESVEKALLKAKKRPHERAGRPEAQAEEPIA
jgi:hypothetical protein